MNRDQRNTTTDAALSSAVLAAVAEREGVEPAELDRPLFDAIDPDALDALFERGSGRVRFTYLGYTVVAHSDGRVDLDGGSG